jgi:hypothetical protein
MNVIVALTPPAKSETRNAAGAIKCAPRCAIAASTQRARWETQPAQDVTKCAQSSS